MERDSVFLALKSQMVNSLIPGYPDPRAKFILDTDMCNYGIGALPSQIQIVDGK